MSDDGTDEWQAFSAGEGLIVAYRVVAVEGDIVPVELRLFAGEIDLDWAFVADDPRPMKPFDTSKPLTRGRVDRIPIATHLDEIKQRMKEPTELEEVADYWAGHLGFTEVLLGDSVKRTSRRHEGTDVYLAVAVLYASAYEAGSKKPTKDTCARLKELGWHYELGSVVNLVGEARQRKYLTKPPQSGVPGGHLTEAAQEALHRFFRGAKDSGST